MLRTQVNLYSFRVWLSSFQVDFSRLLKCLANECVFTKAIFLLDSRQSRRSGKVLNSGYRQTKVHKHLVIFTKRADKGNLIFECQEIIYKPVLMDLV